jgi:hypothetical protein
MITGSSNPALAFKGKTAAGSRARKAKKPVVAKDSITVATPIVLPHKAFSHLRKGVRHGKDKMEKARRYLAGLVYKKVQESSTESTTHTEKEKLYENVAKDASKKARGFIPQYTRRLLTAANLDELQQQLYSRAGYSAEGAFCDRLADQYGTTYAKALIREAKALSGKSSTSSSELTKSDLTGSLKDLEDLTQDQRKKATSYINTINERLLNRKGKNAFSQMKRKRKKAEISSSENEGSDSSSVSRPTTGGKGPETIALIRAQYERRLQQQTENELQTGSLSDLEGVVGNESSTHSPSPPRPTTSGKSIEVVERYLAQQNRTSVKLESDLETSSISGAEEASEDELTTHSNSSPRPTTGGKSIEVLNRYLAQRNLLPVSEQ